MPTLNEVINMSDEEVKELNNKLARRFAIMVAVKVGVAVASAVAVHVIMKKMDELEAQDN